MLVLLTRAIDEAMRTAAHLAALGHYAILSPVLEMVPTGAAWPNGVVDGVLATSAQAFELLGFEQLATEPGRPSPEARRLLPLYVVGERTLNAARARGFEGRATLAPDAETLVRLALPLLAGDAPARFAYLAGRDRKPDLEAQLSDAGHRVEAVEVYAAEPAEALDPEAAAMMESGEIAAALHFSRRSARLFIALARDTGLDIAGLDHVAISADAAAPLSEAGAAVRVAPEPNEQAMLALLAASPAHAFVDRLQGLKP